MQTSCRLFAEMCRLDAEVMQTSTKVCVSRTFFVLRQVCTRWIMKTLCTLLQTSSRKKTDIVQTIKLVCNWHAFLLSSMANCLIVLWFLQDLRGIKGTDPCWLLPGASRGREAGRPRVVWLIHSSAISGGVSHLTGS
jgi:hypothetical protein